MDVVAELKQETLKARTKLDSTECPEKGMTGGLRSRARARLCVISQQSEREREKQETPGEPLQQKLVVDNTSQDKLFPARDPVWKDVRPPTCCFYW